MDRTAKWMEIPVLYSYSLEYLEMRRHGLLFFKMLRLCSLSLTPMTRDGKGGLEDRADPALQSGL